MNVMKIVKTMNLMNILSRLYPPAASHKKYDGRMPLHEAIASRKQWDDGVEALYNSARHAVTQEDKYITKLFPFMMAATVRGGCLDTTHNLLR